MAHYNVRYDGDGAEDRAMEDLRDWFGADRFDTVNELLQKSIADGSIRNRMQFRFQVSFAGVQGYPVEIWADRLGLPADKPEDDDGVTVEEM